MIKPIIYNHKTITSGNVIEQTHYERPVTYGFKLSQKTIDRRKSAQFRKALDFTPEELVEKKIESRKLSMFRAKKKLTRLINSNTRQYLKLDGKEYPPVFLTLTFKEDIRNQKEANELFSLFIKRLNYQTNKTKINTLKYSVVIEFQDKTRNGVIHYHTVFYNLPYTKKEILVQVWDQGFLDVKAIKNIQGLGSYVTKYMSKNFEDPRLDGHKRYFSSRGLIKPKVYAGLTPYEVIRKAIPVNTPTWEKSFNSEKKGLTTKTIFTLRPLKGLKGVLSIEDANKIEPYDIS